MLNIKSSISSIKLFIILYSLFFAFSAHCQDIHFTQFDNSPLNLNPANTGLFFGDYRLCFNDRNQWETVSTPFTTISASFDAKLYTNPFQKETFSAGIVFFRDKAGDSDFGTSEADLTASYTKSIDAFAKHYLSFGIEAGLAQHTVDFSNLSFDNQYNGYVYDPNLASLEQFNKSNFTFADISAGLSWLYLINERTNLNAGFSIYHLNQPDQSILTVGQSKLAPRLSFNCNLQTPIADKLDIEPTVLLSHQGTYNELDFGTMLRFILNRDIYNYTSFNIGVYTRMGDALNFMAGVDYQRFTVGFSYDINYSDLHNASYSQGAREISIIYRMFKPKKTSEILPQCRIL